MKKISKLLVLSSTILLLCLSGCDLSADIGLNYPNGYGGLDTPYSPTDEGETDKPENPTDDEETDEPEIKPSATIIPREYWGTWIRMDTGVEYYIDSDDIYSSSSYDKKYSKVQSGISGFSLDGENVLVNGNYRYFRKGGGSRSFSLTVSGFSDSYSRGASLGQQGIMGRRKNQNNPEDTESVNSDSNGILEFKEAVADDEQKITISSESTETNVEVTPRFDGENVGSIPLIEAGTYGFKTTYTIDSDEQGFCFGNYLREYSLKLMFKNIGTENCATSVYSISCDDPKLIMNGELTGNFSTISAGTSKSVNLSVMYSEVAGAYVDVPIKISITDRKYERTWNDSVMLRFYRGTVGIKVNARNFNKNASATLKGFFIYPDGRSKRFTVENNSVRTIEIPWSEQDYILAFSGATVDNEMAYSFSVRDKSNLADLSGVWSISDMNAYKSNSATTAYRIDDLSKPVKGYLGCDDVEFFKISLRDCDIRFAPVSCNAYSVNDSDSSTNPYNNGDGKINPGEQISMDVRLHNSVDTTVYGIKAELSSTSEYVTIDTASRDYGNIKSGYYKSCYGASYYADSSSYKDGTSYSDSYSAGLKASYGFKYTVSENCPVGTIIPLTLTFTDQHGNIWTDSFSEIVENGPVFLKSISVTTQPTKTIYSWGDSLNTSGMVVKATYSDSSTKTITGWTTSGFDSSSAGDKTVIVTYTENRITKTTSFNVTVKSLSSISIYTAPRKIIYCIGDSLNTSGMVVKATYSDSSTKTVTGWMIREFDSLSVGEKTITVSYTEGDITKTTIFSVLISHKFHETPEKTGTKTIDGKTYDIITFGDWPRTLKAEDVTVDETKTLVMGGNTYYLGSDLYYYAKCKENAYGSDYKYSDNKTTVNQSSANSYKYFKVEPIKWRVLRSGNGNALILAEEILTANVPYSVSTDSRTISGKTVYPNNYRYSTIRAYLNGKYESNDTQAKTYNGTGFLQSAFTESAQELINTRTVENDAYSTTDTGYNLTEATSYICEDTKDKVFLLSEEEVTNSPAGFTAYHTRGTGNSRIRVTTDYAKANSAWQSTTTGYGGYWWLRSPYYDISYYARCVCSDGDADCGYYVRDEIRGVVPALSILY